jgi:hypothetical protein
MLSQRQFNRQAMQNKTQVFSQAPPVGGWNTRDDISDMDPRDAAYLENWFPDTTAVRVRKGCRYEDIVFGLTGFQTMAEFNSEQETALICCADGRVAIHNDSIATLDKIIADDFVRDEWQVINVNNQAILVNGTDAPQLVRSSSGQFICEPANFSGLDPRSLVDGHVFKSRVFYVKEDSADFYYTETDAIAGTLTRFPLSRVARKGGKLICVKSWTIDGGDGPDDIAVFIMSTGEVLAYQGTDPGRSGQWGLIGRYTMPEVINRRCVQQSAGKIFAITKTDLVILPDTFQELTPKPSKLTGAITEAWARYGNLRGWQFTVFQSGGIALLNVPTGAFSSYQCVINLKTSAATKYTGWNTFCFGVWDNKLYFNPPGTNRLVRAEYGLDDNFFGVTTSPITCRARVAPSNLGQQQYKTIKDYRMRISCEGDAYISSGLAYDFSGKPAFNHQVTQETVGTPWGSAWGSPWSDEDFSKDEWIGGAGEGTHVQLVNEVYASRQNLKWYKTDYRFIAGPQIV